MYIKYQEFSSKIGFVKDIGKQRLYLTQETKAQVDNYKKCHSYCKSWKYFYQFVEPLKE